MSSPRVCNFYSDSLIETVTGELLLESLGDSKINLLISSVGGTKDMSIEQVLIIVGLC